MGGDSANDLDVIVAKLTFVESMRMHENDLLAHRTTALVISQTFLFGTFTLANDAVAHQAEPDHVTRLLFSVIPILGVSLALLVLLSVAAAIAMLWFWHFELIALSRAPEAARLAWPRMRRTRAIMILGQLPAIIFPLGLALAWGLLLAQR
jgi:hypothetical protein